MEFINDELKIFCKTTSFDKCLLILKEKLKKNNQMNEYDFIYSSYVSSNELKDFTINNIIPGLQNVIKLMVFCKIYSDKLFPKNIESYTITKKQLDFFNNVLNKTEFSFYSFYKISGELCSLYDICDNSIIKIDLKRIPNNVFSFPYIFLHKAGTVSFETLSDMLFCNEYVKLPIVFKFYPDSTGPHGGFFDVPFNFMTHDYNHMIIMLENIANYNFSEVSNIIKRTQKGSIKRRMIEIYFILIFFETDKYITIKQNVYGNIKPIVYSMKDPKDKFCNLLKILTNDFDENDLFYLIKYLMSSYDLDTITSNTEILTIKYIIYKEDYSTLNNEANEINNKIMYLSKEKIPNREKFGELKLLRKKILCDIYKNKVDFVEDILLSIFKQISID